MAFTYNQGTDLARVRLLITDTNENSPIFQDEEIQEFLDLTGYDTGNDVFYAAALALETIARSEALVQKRITILDLSTDGPAVAKELRESAKELRRKSEEMAGFEIATMNVNNWTSIDLIINKWLRRGL